MAVWAVNAAASRGAALPDGGEGGPGWGPGASAGGRVGSTSFHARQDQLLQEAEMYFGGKA